MSLTPSARKRRKERREQGNEREGDGCNLCFDSYDDLGNLKTPGFVEQSLRVNCGKCSSNKSKVAPSKDSDSSDSPTGQPKNGGRRKTRRKRRKKRRKSRKNRKKTKRRRKRRRKKSKKVRRK